MATDTEDLLRELRQLVIAHERRAVDVPTYRARRARLVDALVGIVPPPAEDATVPRMEAWDREPAPASPPAPVAAPEPVAPPSVAPRGGRLRVIGAALAAGVLLVAALGWYAYAPHGNPGTDGAGAPTAGADVGGAVGPGAGVQRIKDFLQSDDWTDRAVTQAIEDWFGLSERDFQAVQADGTARRLMDAVRARLELAAQPNAPVLAPAAPIVQLAQTLGIKIPSAALGGREPAPPPARPVRIPVIPPPADTAAVASKPVDEAARPSLQAPVNPVTLPVAAATAPAPEPSAPAARPAPSSSTPGAVPGAPAPEGGAAPEPDPCAARQRKRCVDHFGPDNLSGPQLVVVPAGSFQMGGREDQEKPVHAVTIAAPFAMSETELRVGEYRQFCHATGRECPLTGADDLPAVNVSWNDAHDYVKWLSAVTHRVYRLPTEAEWEYAARGGRAEEWKPSEGEAYFGNQKGPQSLDNTRARYIANGFLLRHMLGNAREWTEDAWAPGYLNARADGRARQGPGDRVVRGGSFRDSEDRVRVGAREHLAPGTRDDQTGIRVVRDFTRGP